MKKREYHLDTAYAGIITSGKLQPANKVLVVYRMVKITFKKVTDKSVKINVSYHDDLLCCGEKNKHTDETVKQRLEVRMVGHVGEQIIAEDGVNRDKEEYESEHVEDRRHGL